MASIAMKQLRSRANASGWALLLAALLVAGGAMEAAAALATDLRIEVISNRPDLISGGDALVEVVLPAPPRSRCVPTAASWGLSRA